jgi:hypothetical protein
MSKHRESAADRIWKEKLDSCASPQEAIVVLVLVVALVLAASSIGGL